MLGGDVSPRGAVLAGKKQFDTEAALTSATDLFRRKGYASSSIDDLVQHTGVGRSSLYSTFGNKEQLFLSIFDRYRGEMMSRLVPRADLPPREAMELFFSELLDTMQAWGSGGCLLTNTCAEFAIVPPEVQGHVRDALAEQEAQLRKFFERAERRGELGPAARPTQLASYFVALRQSVCLLWRASESRVRLEGVVAAGLTVLDGGLVR